MKFGGSFGHVIDTVEELGHPLTEGAKQAIHATLTHTFGSGKSGLGLLAKNLGGDKLGLIPRAPIHPGLISGAHPAMPLIQAGQLLGEVIPGAQPYAFAGVKIIPAGTVIAGQTAGAGTPTVIADFFGTAMSTQFTTSYQFPNPFQASRMRFTVTSDSPTGAVDDSAWQETLQVTFLNQTEIARASFNSFGLRTTLSDGTGTAVTEEQKGVAWPVFYQKNTNYIMQLISNSGITTTLAFAVAYALDGWTIQGGLNNMNPAQIQQAVADRIGAPIDQAMQSLRMHLAEAAITPLF